MYSILKFILITSLMTTLFACSEQSPTKVLVVDLSIIAKAVGQNTMINAKLNEANTLLKQRLLTIKDNIEKKVAEEKVKISGTSTNEQQELQALVIKAKQTMLAAQNKAKEQSKLYQEQLLQQFKDDIQPIIASIAEQENASMVRLHNASILWVDNTIDITDQVIVELKKVSAQTPTQAITPANNAITHVEKTDTTDKTKLVEQVK
ncbi:MAG: hypothetical protein COB45_11040 [Gammaproteobacteria bacterium]|nr:MAG: hypothetical protein COB45_11040 [Gammaproteobacteria bacterium]PHR81237.1 MAG: hypothetical protein COA59_16370 [Colwellia sp.]